MERASCRERTERLRHQNRQQPPFTLGPVTQLTKPIAIISVSRLSRALVGTVYNQTTMRCLSLLLLSSVANAALIKAPPLAPMKPKEVPALDKALAIRGGGMIDKGMYVKGVAALFGMYAVQMLAIPGKLHDDHFTDPHTTMTSFWLRGAGVSFITIMYTLVKHGE